MKMLHNYAEKKCMLGSIYFRNYLHTGTGELELLAIANVYICQGKSIGRLTSLISLSMGR